MKDDPIEVTFRPKDIPSDTRARWLTEKNGIPGTVFGEGEGHIEKLLAEGTAFMAEVENFRPGTTLTVHFGTDPANDRMRFHFGPQPENTGGQILHGEEDGDEQFSR